MIDDEKVVVEGEVSETPEAGEATPEASESSEESKTEEQLSLKLEILTDTRKGVFQLVDIESSS